MYKTILPPAELDQYISLSYIMEKEVENVTTQEPELLMPSGTSIMGFHYLGNWEVTFNSGNKPEKIILPDFYTVGQQTISYSLTVSQTKTGIIGAALKPTVLWHWLKKPLNFLVNNPVESDSLFGIEINDLAANFKQLPTHEEKIDLLSEFFFKLKAKSDYKPGLVEVALDEIYARKGCVTTKQLLSITGFKVRSLQTSFKKQVGISPMQYARIMRFNNIFVGIAKKREDQDLSFLSLFYNYYDASHFNKDFKSYCGEAPSSFYIEKFKLLKARVFEIVKPLVPLQLLFTIYFEMEMDSYALSRHEISHLELPSQTVNFLTSRNQDGQISSVITANGNTMYAR